MKKLFLIVIAFAIAGSTKSQINVGGIIKRKTEERATKKIEQGVDKSLDKAEDGAKNPDKNSSSGEQQNNPGSKNTSSPTGNAAASPSYKMYSNYDFVPGDKILFEDNFMDDQDGEFPSHWNLESGQGVINKVGTDMAFALTEGNYVKVAPRIKTESYLTDPFTIELDFFPKSGDYGIMVFFETADGEKSISIKDNGDVNANYFIKSLNGTFPGEHSDAFLNHWHHIAVAFKNQQLKCYVDQYRVLVMPNTETKPTAAAVGGIGSPQNPIVFKNLRLASGGGMNMIGKKFTDSKIVTHGISFDYDKATIKPESMGTLNMIVKVLQENPELKFEVGGHTDSDGEDAYNQKLLQQRADAVKTQLTTMGIDASRLTAKGYGESKPISDNSSPEGKANNRRVEFVKM